MATQTPRMAGPAPAPVPRRFGLTPPVSVACPTARDLRLTAALEQQLHSHNLHESQAQRQRRTKALELLDDVGPARYCSRHVIGCHVTSETRGVIKEENSGAGGCCSPRHMLPSN